MRDKRQGNCHKFRSSLELEMGNKQNRLKEAGNMTSLHVLPENLEEVIPDDAQRALLEDLCSEEYGQSHLLDAYTKDGDAEKLRGLCAQLLKLDGGYTGGLKSYITKAKTLLENSKNGVNPLDGWAPSVPQGEAFELGTDKYKETEAKGMELLGNVGFVLVAGGLGERLGYNGAKVRFISFSSSNKSSNKKGN